MSVSCTECDYEIEPENILFNEDLQCPVCRTWLSTEFEMDSEAMYMWVTGKSSQNHGVIH